MEVAHKVESIFDIRFEFQVTCLVKICASTLIVIIAARTDGAGSKGTDIVGTTYIE